MSRSFLVAAKISHASGLLYKAYGRLCGVFSRLSCPSVQHLSLEQDNSRKTGQIAVKSGTGTVPREWHPMILVSPLTSHQTNGWISMRHSDLSSSLRSNSPLRYKKHVALYLLCVLLPLSLALLHLAALLLLPLLLLSLTHCKRRKHNWLFSLCPPLPP